MKVFLKCLSVCVLQYMEEFAELLVPVTDPRHQVVERLVQHLAQRNKDIPEVSDVSWNVHVVQSPNVNAFVLPVSNRKADVDLQIFMSFMSFWHFVTSLKSYVNLHIFYIVFRSVSSMKYPCDSARWIVLYLACICFLAA